MKLFVFLFGLVAGILLIVYRYQIVRFTGKFSWVEQKLGPGGTYTFIILFAIFLWLFCMMYALGTLDQVFSFLAKFF